MELLESNPDDFFEKIIDPETYIPTELGAKIIRNIVPNEESINKLYTSLKTIEKRAKWFDVSRLLRYSDVEGDPGWYQVSMKVRPHFKYMGASFTLSLVGKLDKS